VVGDQREKGSTELKWGARKGNSSKGMGDGGGEAKWHQGVFKGGRESENFEGCSPKRYREKGPEWKLAEQAKTVREQRTGF